MQTKRYKIKALAAFTAFAGSAVPLYGHAQLKGLPAIELNFDVLQNLDRKEEISGAKSNANEAIKPDVVEKKPSAAPGQAAKQETRQKLKTKIIENQAVTTNPEADKTPEIIDTRPDKESFNVQIPPVVQSPENQQNQAQETKAQKVKKAFGNIGTFFKKIPDMLHKPAADVTPPDVTPLDVAPSDVVAQKPNGDIASGSHNDASALSVKPVDIKEPADESPFANQQNKNKPQKNTVKKTEKQSLNDEAGRVPKPRLKDVQHAGKIPAKAEDKLPKPNLAKPDNKLQARTVKSQEKTAPAKLEQRQVPNSTDDAAIKNLANEPQKKPENNTSVDSPATNADEPTRDSMWKKFLDNAKKKANQGEVTDNAPKNNLETHSQVILQKNIVPSPVVASPPADVLVTQRQNSQNIPVNNEKNVQAIQNNSKPLTAIDNNKKKIDGQETPSTALPPVENSLTQDNKTALQPKLEKALDVNISNKNTAPSIPDAVSEPQVAVLPSGNATSITLKELDKKPDINANNVAQPIAGNSIINLAFAENAVEISNTDKQKITNAVKPILNSSKRIKVMSYAKSTAGDVNASRRISLQRAIAVRSQMIQAGLEKNRINVQAIGSNAENPQLSDGVSIYVIE